VVRSSCERVFRSTSTLTLSKSANAHFNTDATRQTYRRSTGNLAISAKCALTSPPLLHSCHHQPKVRFHVGGTCQFMCPFLASSENAISKALMTKILQNLQLMFQR
jgi:hypothetical protein